MPQNAVHPLVFYRDCPQRRRPTPRRVRRLDKLAKRDGSPPLTFPRTIGFDGRMLDLGLPQELVRDWLIPRGVERVDPMQGGLSGGWVGKCVTANRDNFALKRWPDGVTRARVAEVHHVVRYAASRGCRVLAVPLSVTPNSDGVAESKTFAEFSGRYWEISTWREGLPEDAAASLEKVRLGAAAIAEFHACVSPLKVKTQVAPAVLDRLIRLEERSSKIASLDESAIQDVANAELRRALLDATQLVRWKWDEVRPRIHRSLSQYHDRKVRTQYVLRDVHREHLLFQQGKVSGLIDFDALRVDTTATDLARWVGSFLGGPHHAGEVWEAGLAGFQSNAAFKNGKETEFEAQLAADLCFASTWISLANWLVWLLRERRDFQAEPTALASRIAELVRLASVTAS